MAEVTGCVTVNMLTIEHIGKPKSWPTASTPAIILDSMAEDCPKLVSTLFGLRSERIQNHSPGHKCFLHYACDWLLYRQQAPAKQRIGQPFDPISRFRWSHANQAIFVVGKVTDLDRHLTQPPADVIIL